MRRITEPRDLINGSVELASLPEVVMRAIDLINDPDASAQDIGHVLAEDPALTARLLRIVNSAFYGFPSRIDTVSRAVTVVGTRELLDLVLAATVVKLFAGLPNDLVTMRDFWRHSLYCGVAARALAAQRRETNVEHFFVAGLLHDIGSLIVYRKLPELAREVLARTRFQGHVLHETERELLGYDHAEVGATLLRAWKLPESLIQAVAHHHQPQDAQTHALEAAVVHVADILAGAAAATGGASDHLPPLSGTAWELLSVPVDAIGEVLMEADRQFEEARGLIFSEEAIA